MSAILEASDEDFAPGPNVATVRLQMPCLDCGKFILTISAVDNSSSWCDACVGFTTVRVCRGIVLAPIV